MKIEHRIIDKDKKIVQCTFQDERWYTMEVDGKLTFVPSCTWVCSFYPKSLGFFKWMASKGWDESLALKEAAGDRGSKIHQAVSSLLLGNTVKYDSKFLSPNISKEEELTVDEYEAILSFVYWHQENKPEIVAFDETVFARDNSYAGTLDLRCLIEKEKWLIDFKTSQEIWPSHEIQVSAYKHTGFEDHKIGILQLGYRRNRKKFKFTEIVDQYDLFLAARRIWQKETEGIVPLQKDLPLEVKL